MTRLTIIDLVLVAGVIVHTQLFLSEFGVGGGTCQCTHSEIVGFLLPKLTRVVISIFGAYQILLLHPSSVRLFAGTC